MKVIAATIALLVLGYLEESYANPTSKAYIPFRTSPFDQDHLHHQLEWTPDNTVSKWKSYDPDQATSDDSCPLQFSLGISRRLHHAPRKGGLGIVEPPVIFPILPALGPGRQVLYTTKYEHLDMLTPLQTTPTTSDSMVKEGLTQHVEFPLLFESSAFLTSPVIADVNGDGIVDAILADYDGGIYAIGLQQKDGGKRYFHRAQVPRLYLRRQWMEAKVNETLGIKPHEEEEVVEEEPELKAGNETEDAPVDKSSRKKVEKTHDPYHSYFEYTYGTDEDHEPILRAVTANVLGQDQEHVQHLEQRRKRKIQHHPVNGEEESPVSEEEESLEGEQDHRRLQEVVVNPTDQHHRRLQETIDTHDGGEVHESQPNEDESERRAAAEQVEGGSLTADSSEPELHSESEGGEDHSEDGGDLPASQDSEDYRREYLDDLYQGDFEEDFNFHGDDVGMAQGDDAAIFGDDDYMSSGDVARGDDMYPSYGHDDHYGRYDDYYGRYETDQNEYYDEKHYVRIPPHILCTPVVAEFPKLYTQSGETEMLLFVAVSYYFDEDEYDGFFSYKRFKDRDHGDETEVQRGMYVANAIAVYQFGQAPRWGRQEHLDLSGDQSAPINTTLVGRIPLKEDVSKMGAFALSSPTVADLDGDGSMEVLMGTSMGIVYLLDARNLYSREHWPVQFQYGIESRILVEDVTGDTNLEIFVADVGGNVVCLNHKAEKIWHRNLVSSISGFKSGDILAMSPMVLGDVDGDGMLDVVVVVTVRADAKESQYLFALSADSGRDVNNFPVRISHEEKKSQDDGEDQVAKKLPAPLLVDLHSEQAWVDSYIRRNGTKFNKPTPSKTQGVAPQGGRSIGLHIVQPVGTNLVVMEAGSGCFQTISVGDEILTMVQADDVHGTGNLDLVISTASGNLITLKSPSPFHPLNVWNNGEVRGRSNTFAHGYSASQGIFVHEVSRQYRDIFGVYVPVTFEIFDNRPNIKNEPDRQTYEVEIREGTSRPVFRKTYNEVGVYTERFYIPHGPGYYVLSAVLKSTHGLVFEDTFHLGYNVNYMDGFGLMLWLPLVLASICIFHWSSSKSTWEDDDGDGDIPSNPQGILGSPLPS